MVPEGKVRIHELWKWLENAGNYGNTDFCSILRWVVGLYSKSSILFGVYVGTGRCVCMWVWRTTLIFVPWALSALLFETVSHWSGTHQIASWADLFLSPQWWGYNCRPDHA